MLDVLTFTAQQAPSLTVLVILVFFFFKHLGKIEDRQENFYGKILDRYDETIQNNSKALNELTTNIKILASYGKPKSD